MRHLEVSFVLQLWRRRSMVFLWRRKMVFLWRRSMELWRM
jgi:hypothetical protein